MKRNLAMIVILLLIALALVGAFVAMTDNADNCLDTGGCWDKVDKICRNDEPGAQSLCDRK
jgi:hypothetical protein